MRVFITGGAGFLGSNFIHFLLAKYPDISILNFDKLTYAGNLENLKDIEKDFRYQFVQGDIAQAAEVENYLDGVDVVINFAAETHVDRSILNPTDFLQTNIFGVYNLLELVKKKKIPRFIQISTDEVFGPILEGEASEESPFRPTSPYSASKASAEHLCRAYFHTYKIPVIIIHACNCFGPYQYPEKLIPLFVTNLLEGKKVPVYGDGQQEREWLFTEDFCRGLDLVLQKGKEGESYNLGSGKRLKNLDLTKMILGYFGLDESWIDYVTDRPGHDRRYALSSLKAKKELGFEPKESFEEALSKTIDWYKTHESWWKRIKSGEFLKYYQRQYKREL